MDQVESHVDMYSESRRIPLRKQPATLQVTFQDLGISPALQLCHEFLDLVEKARLLLVLVHKECGTLSPRNQHGHHAV
jgi:hypothetical protein